MKYLKLYEQFDFDENDPFGEEIEYTEPTFLSWLKKNYPDENTWSKIKEIDCNNKHLISLEGIENLVNLKELYCYDNDLTNLEGIENLVNLQLLSCRNNKITSLEGIKLKNIMNLKYLNCSINQLTSLEGIEKLVNLKELYCYRNRLTMEYKNYLRDYCKERKISLII